MGTEEQTAALTDAATTSSLVEKLCRWGLQWPVDLERLAIARGCDYYERDFEPRVPPLPEVPLTNAELAIALVLPTLRPQARHVRLAAALLGTPQMRAEDVASLATRENCAPVIRFIALCGCRFEPGNHFWKQLLRQLPEVPTNLQHLPHPTRFVEMTGVDRGRIGLATRWIRPAHRSAA